MPGVCLRSAAGFTPEPPYRRKIRACRSRGVRRSRGTHSKPDHHQLLAFDAAFPLDPDHRRLDHRGSCRRRLRRATLLDQQDVASRSRSWRVYNDDAGPLRHRERDRHCVGCDSIVGRLPPSGRTNIASGFSRRSAFSEYPRPGRRGRRQTSEAACAALSGLKRHHGNPRPADESASNTRAPSGRRESGPEAPSLAFPPPRAPLPRSHHFGACRCLMKIFRFPRNLPLPSHDILCTT